MVSCVPVTYFDSSDARYTTPAAMSAGSPNRGTRMCCSNAARSVGSATIAAIVGVPV